MGHLDYIEPKPKENIDAFRYKLFISYNFLFDALELE